MSLPPEIVERLTKSMLPERVCLTCGNPSRRVVGSSAMMAFQPAVGAYIRERRLALGISTKTVNDWFPKKSVWLHRWEPGSSQPLLPTPEQWAILKAGLDLDDRFDGVIEPRNAVGYEDISDHPSGRTQNAQGDVYQRLPSTKSRLTPDRFTDCGHNNWRPGIVLDPFANSQGEPMTATFYVGDAIETMNALPEKSVDLILTSPPFLALRSYLPADHPDKNLEGGSQSTPGEFIDWLLDVVDACARVLAPHGSLVFELGDTYSGSGGAGGDYAADGLREGQPKFRQNHLYEGSNPDGGFHGSADMKAMDGVPYNGGRGWPLAKSLSLIPESFRWAMVYGHNPFTGRTCDTWRLRNVIRWVRPNPPVGALGDKFRPATSELMVFCKAKDRFFDLDAVRAVNNPERMDEEPMRSPKHFVNQNPNTGWAKTGPSLGSNNPAGAPPLDWWSIPLLEGEEPTRYGPKEPQTREAPARVEPKQTRMKAEGVATHGVSIAMVDRTYYQYGNAPPLDWWNIPPGGYPGAHYAVWPPELLIKPVKAMCPEKVCRVCGEPSRRIEGEASYFDPRAGEFKEGRVWRSGMRDEDGRVWKGTRGEDKGAHALKSPPGGRNVLNRVPNTLGFSDCGHDDWRPGLVLDCFGGSGTTALVATGHGRDCILIDIDSRNVALARDRIGSLFFEEGHVGETSRSDSPLLAEGGTPE